MRNQTDVRFKFTEWERFNVQPRIKFTNLIEETVHSINNANTVKSIYRSKLNIDLTES